MYKCYRELSRLISFEERFAYLNLNGQVGHDTFGFDRYLNQMFYRSDTWKRLRDQILIRDCGCDLGVEGFEIGGKILVHHMNPISTEDILEKTDKLLNPEYLICVSQGTHNAIHYGDFNSLTTAPTARTPNDTCPWKQ